VLDYKIKRFLLNPHRIKYFHEAQTVFDYLKINETVENDDFGTLMFELKSQKDPDSYFQTTENKKIFIECLEKTEPYKQWVSEFERVQAYNKLSAFDKTLYYLVVYYRKVIKYPNGLMAYWYAGITNWANYRFRIERFKQETQEKFDNAYKRCSDLEQEVIKLKAKVYKKRNRKSTIKTNVKKKTNKPN
jgi:hypothetical protein